MLTWGIYTENLQQMFTFLWACLNNFSGKSWMWSQEFYCKSFRSKIVIAYPIILHHAWNVFLLRVYSHFLEAGEYIFSHKCYRVFPLQSQTMWLLFLKPVVVLKPVLPPLWRRGALQLYLKCHSSARTLCKVVCLLACVESDATTVGRYIYRNA